MIWVKASLLIRNAEIKTAKTCREATSGQQEVVIHLTDEVDVIERRESESVESHDTHC